MVFHSLRRWLSARSRRKPATPALRKTCKPDVERLEDRTVQAVSVGYQDIATAVTVDSGGNIYVAGGFRHWVDFNPGAGQSWLQGTDRTQDLAAGAGFLAKYSPSGSLLWAAKTTDTPETTLQDELKTHTDGTNTSVYFFRADGGSTTTKYGGDGSLLWQKGGAPTYSRFAVDSSGAVYFVGRFTGTVDMDGSNPPTTADTLTADGTDVYVIKWDADGNFLWA